MTAKCSSLSADEFAKFFKQKVETVRAATATALSLPTASTASSFVDHWSRVQPDEVVKLISRSPNKSCLLDPVPTWIVKEFSSLLAPFITRLFNASLDSGSYPQNFKHAIVLPLLKKENLDAAQLNNYRPISNLTFLSKLLERVVLERLQQYLDRGCGLPRYQSAYRKCHSTETALLKVVNDLLLAADRGEVSALCLVGLSAAFDTVDHELLLSRLQNRFGVVGTALNWFRSYLTNRSYAVMYGSNLSDVVQLVCSVPQGSMLGPLLFLLYTAELEDMAAGMGSTFTCTLMILSYTSTASRQG